MKRRLHLGFFDYLSINRNLTFDPRVLRIQHNPAVMTEEKTFRMPEFADRVTSVGPNPFLPLLQAKARIEKETGQTVLNLSVGSPDYTPSRFFIEEVRKRYTDRDAHLYPGFPAVPELADAIISFYSQHHGVSLESLELYPLNGAKEGIANLAGAFLNKGDQVLVPDPGYPTYSSSAKRVGARVLTYKLGTGDYPNIDLNELEEKVTPKTKFIWVNFPSNPTGQVAVKEDLEKLVNFARSRNICIAYDNAYAEITFGGFIAPSILEVPGAKKLAVEYRSYSKTFSFAGYRMAWIAGNKEIIKALAVIKSDIDSGLSLPLQRLGAFALNSFDKYWCRKWREDMIESYQKRREAIAGLLSSLGLEFRLPLASLYLWARIQTGENSMDYCMGLLKNKKILLTPGSSFGAAGEGYVRAAICVNVDRIKDYF